MSAEPERAENEVIRVKLNYDKNQYVAEIVCGETLEYMKTRHSRLCGCVLPWAF